MKQENSVAMYSEPTIDPIYDCKCVLPINFYFLENIFQKEYDFEHEVI